MAPRLGLVAFAAALALPACDDLSNGAVGEACPQAGFRCATPACSEFPTTPGCSDVAPTNQRCPLGAPHCFDPSTAMGYCDPTRAACTLSPDGGAACPALLCTRAALTSCYVVTDDLFCRGAETCVRFGCPQDGGAPTD
jgi:hypothetical protein